MSAAIDWFAVLGGGMGFDGLGSGEQWNGLDMGNGASPGEGNGNVGGGDVVREFGYSQDVETASSEESGADVAAHVFNGCADGFKAIIGML